MKCVTDAVIFGQAYHSFMFIFILFFSSALTGEIKIIYYLLSSTVAINSGASFEGGWGGRRPKEKEKKEKKKEKIEKREKKKKRKKERREL